MAQTAYGVNANEAVKLWSRKLMREALKATWALGPLRDLGAPVRQRAENNLVNCWNAKSWMM